MRNPIRRWSVCIVGLLAVVSASFISLDLYLPGRAERPMLQLPSAYASPGEVITFYGADYQADTIVWCLDRSGSMDWGGTLTVLKAEVTAAIEQLSPAQEFGLVRFNTSVESFSAVLLPGIDSNKVAAITWVNAMTAAGGTCMEQAILQGLFIAQNTSGCSPLILVVSDGVPECGAGPSAAAQAQLLANVAAANVFNIPIIGTFLGASAAGIAFMAELTAANPGPYILQTDAFLRGDADGDGNVQPLLDSIFILAAQFVPGSPFPSCPDSADVDDDGVFQGLLDAFYLLSWGFGQGNPPPPAPGVLGCGFDPTADALDCGSGVLCP